MMTKAPPKKPKIVLPSEKQRARETAFKDLPAGVQKNASALSGAIRKAASSPTPAPTKGEIRDAAIVKAVNILLDVLPDAC